VCATPFDDRGAFFAANRKRRGKVSRLAVLTIWMVLSVEGLLAAGNNLPEVHRLQVSDPYHLVPVMANNPGQFGAVFKTRVSILNPTSFSYPIFVNLYGPNGRVGTRTINILPRESKNYQNFLQEVFSYSGAGSVEFDSWFDPPAGLPDYQFLVSAEVYTDSPNGQYKTVVTTGGPVEDIGPSRESYSPGISVNASARTNIGCFNDSTSAQTIQARLYSPSGSLIQTYPISLPGNGWAQTGISDTVSGGYILWQPQSSCYCYAVVVDNTSNDGTFINASRYVP
jgi:hypothetical protein